MEMNHSLTTKERKSIDLSDRIEGWGADLDGEMRPGVPRDKAPDIGPDQLYPPIEQQVPYARIHKSTEHMKLTPVFGTAAPPKGLSGAMRNFAYRYSEGRWTHWLTLLAADRVDMVEHTIADLAKGHVPNIWKEMGLSSEWKYNRKNFAKKLAITGAAAVGVGLLLVWRMKRNRVVNAAD